MRTPSTVPCSGHFVGARIGDRGEAVSHEPDEERSERRGGEAWKARRARRCSKERAAGGGQAAHAAVERMTDKAGGRGGEQRDAQSWRAMRRRVAERAAVATLGADEVGCWLVPTVGVPRRLSAGSAWLCRLCLALLGSAGSAWLRRRRMRDGEEVSHHPFKHGAAARIPSAATRRVLAA